MWSSIFMIFRSIVEILYFVSGIVIAIFAFLGLKQLRIAFEQLKASIKQVEIGMSQVSIGMEQISLLKQDIESRNKRQAVEKSIEFIERYKNVIFKLDREHSEKMKENNFEYYKVAVNNINDLPFSDNDGFRKCFDKLLKTNGGGLFNELELFSSAFVSRLADEELAFQPLGKSFVNLIDRNYDLFCVCRSHAPYMNTVELYKLWKERLKKIEIDKKINKLENERSQIKETKIVPIGIEEK